jgi:hypothetical protein
VHLFTRIREHFRRELLGADAPASSSQAGTAQ